VRKEEGSMVHAVLYEHDAQPEVSTAPGAKGKATNMMMSKLH
jgi:hypothetical protein